MNAPASAPSALGIDYKARKLNLAIVRGSSVVYQDEAQLGRDTAVQIGVITDALERAQAQADHPATVVIEAMFTRVGAGFATAELIHKTAIRVETIALMLQMRVHWVPVNTWRKVVLGNGGLRSAEGKERALWYVERVMGVKAASDDAADAICLAQYGVLTARVREAAL